MINQIKLLNEQKEIPKDGTIHEEELFKLLYLNNIEKDNVT